ncbi:MAG: transcription repressor NadR [Firmicutes bacterium]|nr:transcription repressor NadR [Bacillota bacterium]
METTERREAILAMLTKAERPLTGTELAVRFGVSRQVIVQDIALLRAAGEQILATPQGYLLPQLQKSDNVQAVVACQHSREEIEHELSLVVDLGGKILDVVVEHPLYGEIKGNLMIASRRDVQNFVKQMDSSQAQPLAVLTAGIHLHTIEAPTASVLDEIVAALREAGFLVM